MRVWLLKLIAMKERSYHDLILSNFSYQKLQDELSEKHQMTADLINSAND